MAVKRVGRAEWARRVQEWKSSGKSAATYAVEQGFNPRTLVWWASVGLRKDRRDKPLSFVEVTPIGAPIIRHGLEVRLRNGRRIRVLGDVDVARLRAVVTALEG